MTSPVHISPFAVASLEVRARSLASILVLIFAGTLGPTLVAQEVTDSQGLIRSDRWLALGPFRQDAGCTTTSGELLANHIAPSKIGCEYPSGGDAVDFDLAMAASSDYVGPKAGDGRPLWRPFRDGENDGIIDLRLDESFPCDGGEDFTCSGFVTFLVTYLELKSDSPPVNIELCLGIDDGAQVWWDGTLVLNRPGCGPSVACRDRLPLTVQPGVHRVVLASFDGGAAWASRFGLLEDGRPIRDGDPNWVFHGEKRPDYPFPECDVILPVHDLLCEMTADGVVELFWNNPPDDVRGESIEVSLDGQLLETLFSDETTTIVVPEDFTEPGAHEVCLVNGSEIPACCGFEVPPPFRALGCERTPGGGLSLRWDHAFRPLADREIEVRIDGEPIAKIAATRTDVTLAQALIPADPKSVCLVDHRGIEVCCDLQITDPDGLIRTRNWLVLGPFVQEMDCNGRDLDERLLLNYTFPTEIRCQYPSDGSPVSYDAFLAASKDYVGPWVAGPRPVWRIFEDGSPENGDLDLRRDPEAAELHSAAVSFLATYVEFRGGLPVEVDFCFGADDAAQLWLDDQLVFNKYECGTREVCEHSATTLLTPGPHRITLGVFRSDGEWGTSLALLVGGEAVVDDPVRWPEWTFHGVRRPDAPYSCSGGEICGSGRDEDGDGLTDCDDPDCRGTAECPLQPEFRRGDVNGDERLDVTDPILNLTYQFVGGFDPQCPDALDFDDSGLVEITDPIANLTRQFLGGAPAQPPGSADCGPDPTEDALDCTTPRSCG